MLNKYNLRALQYKEVSRRVNTSVLQHCTIMLCSMANPNSIPLHEKTWLKPIFHGVMDSFILLLLLLLLAHRVFFSFLLNCYSFPLIVAFLCESSFALTWAATLSTKWSPAEVKTFPERLLHRYLIT